jgi:MFS family permease
MVRLVVIFIAVFFFSLHFAATLYINSSFLEHFFSLRMIGFWYAVGALGNIFMFLKAPLMLARWGVRKFLFVFLWLTLIATIGAAYAFSPIDAAIFFVIYMGAAPMVYYALDLMLEERSSDAKTGEIRGIYLTLLNVAIAVGPLLITVMGTDGRFKAFYLAAAIILIPLFILIYFFLPEKRKKSFGSTALPFKLWWKRKSVRRVSISRLILEFFYAFMAIYTPIYLHSHIGFSWTEIGVIFSIMLLPFILFEWPAGELADRRFGEKEIMSLGFFITLVALLFMPYLGKDAVAWTIALFASRIGAAFVEITTESYFFKQVSSEDAGLISIFRLGRSMGLILGAGAGAVAIFFWPFWSIFIVLAVASFLGWRFSRKLVDTK